MEVSLYIRLFLQFATPTLINFNPFIIYCVYILYHPHTPLLPPKPWKRPSINSPLPIDLSQFPCVDFIVQNNLCIKIRYHSLCHKFHDTTKCASNIYYSFTHAVHKILSYPISVHLSTLLFSFLSNTQGFSFFSILILDFPF